MSTPQTLVQTLPAHHHLDHRQRYLPSPQDRYLPPPRPSSIASTGYSTQQVPTRPSSNVSNQHHPLPAHPSRPQSGLGNGFVQTPSQPRGSEYIYTNGVPPSSSHHHHHQSSGDDLRRTVSRSSQNTRTLPQPTPGSQSRGLQSATAPMPPQQQSNGSIRQDDDLDQGSRPRKQVDWIKFFGGKPPTEIIEIHDDDSPPPPQPPVHSHSQAPRPQVAPPQPPPHASSSSYNSQHVDKRRRVDAGSDIPTYSTTNTPYSYSNGASTESLAATTAPTSIGSQASSSATRLENTQIGQKRKRPTRNTEAERKKQEKSGPRGYLAEYGDYIPPPKQHKKQREVIVPHVTDRHKSSEKIDDDDGHYIVHENSRLGDRYSLMKLLGQGTFGKVVQALDIKTRKEVAVKIIRAVPKYRDASRIELRVLQTLRAADEQNRNRCIQLRDCFDWRGHICIVTPLLGLSVFDFLKQGGFVPFPGSHIQAFAKQLLGSIAFLHDLNLIHTDLKPENILLLNATYQTFTYNRNIPSSSQLTARNAKFRRVLLSPQINLIDFGSATFDDEYHSSVVSTRHYRAPEIILGIGWSHPIDLWSLGCILVECWTGDALFQTHDCCEHLAMMEAVIGQAIDKSLIREVSKHSKRGDRNSATRFFKNGHLAYPFPDTPRQSKKFVRSMKRLEETIPPTTQFNKLFLDLLRKIFVYDPKKRITAHEALKHPWFDEIVEDDGTEAGRIRIERERMAQRAEQDRLQERLQIEASLQRRR